MWLARENDGRLLFFIEKPFRSKKYCEDEDEFWCSIDDGFYLYTDTYPEVTFDNSPVEVELKLKL